MEKTIDLKEILTKNTLGKPFRHGLIIDAMREACNQTVDLCTERVDKLHYDDIVIKNHVHDILTRIQLTKNEIK